MLAVRQSKRLEHFLILRLVIALAGLLLVQLWEESLPAKPAAACSMLLYLALGLYLLECIGALFIRRWVHNTSVFGGLQAGVDLLVVGFMVATTGGAGSLFCPLFFATVLAASTVFDIRGSLMCSSAATVVLAVTSLIQPVLGNTGVLYEPNNWRLASTLLTYGLALHGVSLLSARLVGSLAEATNLTRDIVETMGEGLIAVDKAGKILIFNNEARRLLGTESNYGLDGKAIEQVLPPQARSAICDAVLRDGKRLVRTTLERPDGTSVPVEIKASDLRGRNGEVRGTVVLLTDLTLHRRVDAAVKRIAKLEELTELARSIAHEVRNPLASMCGCAEEIAREPGLRGETKRLAEILVREARRIDGIVDEFLAFARIRAVNAGPVNVAELLNNIALLLRVRTRRSDQRIETAPLTEALTVAGDYDLLMQLFLNIGINALEAFDEGPGVVRLEAEPGDPPFPPDMTRDERHEKGVCIKVSDNGPGIPEEDLRKIFNPFYSGKARGTGLGLTIAHRIVQAHGGAVHVESTPGAGTTFTVWLPEWKQTGGERTGQEAVCQSL